MLEAIGTTGCFHSTLAQQWAIWFVESQFNFTGRRIRGIHSKTRDATVKIKVLVDGVIPIMDVDQAGSIDIGDGNVVCASSWPDFPSNSPAQTEVKRVSRR